MQLVAGHNGRRGRLEALLNLAREIQLALQPLTINLFFDEPRVLDADRGDRGERGQHRQMILREARLRQRRVGVDEAEDFFADAERDSQDGADALNRHR